MSAVATAITVTVFDAITGTPIPAILDQPTTHIPALSTVTAAAPATGRTLVATPATGRTARLALALGSRNLFFLRVEFIFSTKIDRLIDKGVEDNIEALHRSTAVEDF